MSFSKTENYNHSPPWVWEWELGFESHLYLLLSWRDWLNLSKSRFSCTMKTSPVIGLLRGFRMMAMKVRPRGLVRPLFLYGYHGGHSNTYHLTLLCRVKVIVYTTANKKEFLGSPRGPPEFGIHYIFWPTVTHCEHDCFLLYQTLELDLMAVRWREKKKKTIMQQHKQSMKQSSWHVVISNS